ncbi:hypothetical protein AB3S75_007988 [Citrus x aurantiifolia]
MVEPEVRAGSNRSATKEENRQRYTDHARGLSSTRDEEFEKRSDPDCCDSVGGSSHSERLADTSTSFRTFCESLLRKELAELEMIKSREALRCEAEKRRMESEAEMTRVMMQTQLQIASFVEGMNSSRKRKRAEEDESRVSQREGALLLSMLQCNFIL